MDIIGIDLDNTIIQYDQVIYDIAVMKGLIPESTPPNKTIIRDIFRSSGRESLWTGIQGYVYGEGMRSASPFPGIIQFLQVLSRHGFSPCIISHRTKFPYAGGDIDLHLAAMDWLIQEEITGFLKAPIPRERIFFELTKEAKYLRIKQENCRIFIDDLVEFLVSDHFPAKVTPVLFDPFNNYPDDPGYLRFGSWDKAFRTIQKI